MTRQTETKHINPFKKFKSKAATKLPSVPCSSMQSWKTIKDLPERIFTTSYNKPFLGDGDTVLVFVNLKFYSSIFPIWFPWKTIRGLPKLHPSLSWLSHSPVTPPPILSTSRQGFQPLLPLVQRNSPSLQLGWVWEWHWYKRDKVKGLSQEIFITALFFF